MKYLKIAENKEEEVVKINDLEVSGHIAEWDHCKICKQAKVYYEDHDCYFCPRCNIWLECNCSDPTCEYCTGRPKRPLHAPLDTDYPVLETLANDLESILQIIPMAQDEDPEYTPEMIIVRLTELLEESFIFSKQSVNFTKLLEEYYKSEYSDVWFGLTEKGTDSWEKLALKLTGKPITWNDSWTGHFDYEHKKGSIWATEEKICRDQFDALKNHNEILPIWDSAKIVKIDSFKAKYYKTIKGGYRLDFDFQLKKIPN